MAEDTILITGGSGFAGSHLVAALLEKGQVPHVTHYGNRLPAMLEKLPADHIHSLNLSDTAAVKALFETVRPTQLYHLAALASAGNSFQQMEETLENNQKLQLVILEQLRQVLPKTRTLVIGSSLEYDPFAAGLQPNLEPIAETHPLGPISPYAVSKVMQDLLALSYYYSYSLPIIRTRPFNHTGEGQSPDFAIPAFAKQIVAIERGQQTEIKVGDLKAVRDITDVKDIVQGYIVLMEKGQVGEVYNLGRGQGSTMEEILDEICGMSQVKVAVKTDPERLRPNDVPYLVADISKIKALGWQPTIELKETLHSVLEYWRQQS